MITSEQVERFISAAKEGRKTYAPMKFIIFAERLADDGGILKCACITGAAAWGLDVDRAVVDKPLHIRYAAATVYQVCAHVLEKLGVDPELEVRMIDGNREILYKAIPMSYDAHEDEPADDEEFYEWLRGLPAQGANDGQA